MNHQMTQFSADHSPISSSAIFGRQRRRLTSLALAIGFMAIAAPAFAHHPLEGKQASTFIEGLLSGFGHPVLGLDHLAFVVALGLFATVFRESLKQLIWIPISFALATLLGVGLHLMAMDMPVAESLVASTVVGIGILLVLNDRIKATGIFAFGAIAGIFHGYAYGESIVGAELSPIVAYLIGLTLIQVAIACGAFVVGRVVKSYLPQNTVTLFRYVGLIFGALGIVLLGNTFVA